MIRRLLPGLLLILAAEGAALACSCVVPARPEESRRFAREAVRHAFAIVEAEVLTEYRMGGPGEQVRVHRVLWGEAPEEFRIARGEFASSAACDLLLPRGQRRVLILYEPDSVFEITRSASYRAQPGEFSIHNLCSDYLLSERYLDVTLEEARRHGGSARTAGERG